MKIKTKKQLNLPQLIEWAWENDVKGKRFETAAQEDYPGTVYVTDGRGILIDRNVFEGELFTVEEEIEITVFTVLPKVLVKLNHNDMAREYCNSKINDFVLENIKSIYIVNDDLTMTLIWTHDKGLVE